MSYDFFRGRRLRKSDALLNMTTETKLHPSDFISPLFVSELVSEPEEIKAMPGIYNFPLDKIAAEADRIYKLGIPAVLLFGTPSAKDPKGKVSLKKNGIIQQAIKAIKDKNDKITVITDVCLCEYTDHGHCGILSGHEVDNDATLEVLAAQALSHATAGADMVAPSDMMDGRVEAIRDVLDGNGFESTAIMAYSAKYCSAFYGPFREAVDSAPKFGDRRSYQMNPPNIREAMREINADCEEGADIVMVKPALSYLDVIAKARDTFDVPIAAYNVSGEYSMVKLMAKAGLADEKRLALEILTSIKRAGADIIISYHSADAAEWLKV